MSFVSCKNGPSGGTGGFDEGTVTLSTTTTTKITLGYKPRFFCMFTSVDNLHASVHIYDESAIGFTTTRVWQAFQSGASSSSANGANIPNTTSNSINSVDSDGVTIGKVSATYGTTGHYIALR